MKIGILALQGAFAEHAAALKKLSVRSVELRQLGDLKDNLDGLIIPGGESTVMGKLLLELNMLKPLKEMITGGLPVFGTCAGLILLAKEVRINGAENSIEKRPHLATMDITARRNAYGRQLGSFYTVAEFKGLGEIPMTFIRAPYIESVAEDTEVLAVVDEHIVAARQKKQIVTAFHPELNDSLSLAVHKYFLDII